MSNMQIELEQGAPHTFQEAVSGINWNLFQHWFGLEAHVTQADIFEVSDVELGKTGMCFPMVSESTRVRPTFFPTVFLYSPNERFENQSYGLFGLEYAAAWLIILKELNAGLSELASIQAVFGKTSKIGIINFFHSRFPGHTQVGMKFSNGLRQPLHPLLDMQWPHSNNSRHPVTTYSYEVNTNSLKRDYSSIHQLSHAIQTGLNRLSK